MFSFYFFKQNLGKPLFPSHLEVSILGDTPICQSLSVAPVPNASCCVSEDRMMGGGSSLASSPLVERVLWAEGG